MLHAGIILVAVLCSIMAYNIFSVTREGLKAKKNKATKATKATKPTKPTKAKALTKKQLAAAAKAAAAKAAADKVANDLKTAVEKLDKDKKEKLAKVMETAAITAGYETPALFVQAATAANYSTPALFSADIHDAGFILGSDFLTALKKSEYSSYDAFKADLDKINKAYGATWTPNYVLTTFSTAGGSIKNQWTSIINDDGL